MLLELIGAGATSRIGAQENEHTETRTALRNRHRVKTLTTQAGDPDLAIPKLRSGSFFRGGGRGRCSTWRSGGCARGGCCCPA
ncbi:transposase [Streptomyces sp. NPDC040724]|uniref:transposase n=1 Tax=unclassified Streptomyces TaxID=2593676 RepID=UPI00340398DA